MDCYFGHLLLIILYFDLKIDKFYFAFLFLIFFCSILDNCLIGLKITNNLTDENVRYVKDLLVTYGLEEFMYSYPSSLSGGMRQRVL